MSDREPDNQPDNQLRRQPDQPDRSSDVDAVHIPAPRAPLDDQPDIPVPAPPDQPQHQDGSRPDNGLVEPGFRYEQTWKRGKRRRYHGFVERVGGVEGERLREDLAAALRDLLDWAAQYDGANGPDTNGTESVDGADSGDSKDSDDGGRSS